MNILQKIDKLKDDLSQQITQAVIDQNVPTGTNITVRKNTTASF